MNGFIDVCRVYAKGQFQTIICSVEVLNEYGQKQIHI